MSQDCVFCKICNGLSPSFSLFSDDLVKVFLTIDPVSKGHMLVVPKEHYKDLFETPNNVLERINVVSKKMAILCKEKLGATGVNVLNASGKDAQQSVFHLHYHVVPRFDDDALDLWFHQQENKEIDVESIFKKLS